jgi:hypothetical protein
MSFQTGAIELKTSQRHAALCVLRELGERQWRGINDLALFLRAEALDAVREKLNLKKAADPRGHPMWSKDGSAFAFPLRLSGRYFPKGQPVSRRDAEELSQGDAARRSGGSTAWKFRILSEAGQT